MPPLPLFIAYAQEDEPLFRELDAHLAPLRQEKLIRDWHVGLVGAGQDTQEEIGRQIDAAKLILLLVSASFLHGCAEELDRALARGRGGARVVPVIVRACDWSALPIGGHAALPAGTRPVTAWPDRDAAWTDVVTGLRKVLHAAPTPRYADTETRDLSWLLETTRARRAKLLEIGQPTAEVDREILDLRRRLREGGRLRAGDALGDDGRYTLLEQVGRGGFSLVWEAYDRVRKKHVAVKVLNPSHAYDKTRLERFLRGARIMTALQHDAVARVLEPHAVDDGYHYFVMEYLAGGDLRRAVGRKAIQRADVTRIILAVGEALALAHARGVVHRDVKPANVLLDELGRPKLTDFDLVSVRDSTGGTGTGALGTLIYAAPELLSSPQDADARADVYGLAMTMVFALHGGDLPLSVIRSVAPLLDGLPCRHPVRTVLRRALHWDARVRQPDAAAFCEDLRRAEEKSTLFPPPPDPALAGRDLSRANLRNRDLTGADLSGVRLVGADLRFAKLCDARLVGADLTYARLTGADLGHADLSSARLLGADLHDAVLEGARLREAKVVGAQLDAGALDGCDVFGAALPTSEAAVTPTVALASRCRAVAYSPDGSFLASGHVDGTVRIWDAASGEARRIFSGHRAPVTAVAFTPDGQMLASASADRTVRVWELATAKEKQVLAKHRDAVTSLAFSGLFSTTLATGSADGAVRLWVVSTGAEHRVLEHRVLAAGAPVTAVALGAHGTTIAAGTADGHVWLWDEGTTALRHRFSAGARVHALAFSPDGATLAVASAAASVLLWDVATAAERRVLRGCDGPVTSVAFSPDGALVAGASKDGTVRLWDLAAGEHRHVLRGHRAAVRSIAFCPDGLTLASGSTDQTLRIWDLATASTQRDLSTGQTSSLLGMALSPDGATVACTSIDETVRLWNVAAGTERRVFRGDHGPILCVAYHPGGAILAGGSKDGVLWRWDLAAEGARRPLARCGAPLLGVAFDPRGAAVAAACEDGAVRVWDAVTGAPSLSLAAHAGAVWSVAFSPDGALLASAGRDGAARLWHTATGAPAPALAPHPAPVLCVAFDPRGHTLATASEDGAVRLWDVATGALRHVLEGHDRAVVTVAFSPDGALLATGSDDRSVRLWDASTGNALRGLREGHAACVVRVAFTPDGALLASASHDGTLRLWNPMNGRCLAAFLPLEHGWVAFTPDGRYRMSGHTAGAFWHAIGLCRFEPGELDDHVQRALLVLHGGHLLEQALPGRARPMVMASLG